MGLTWLSHFDNSFHKFVKFIRVWSEPVLRIFWPMGSFILVKYHCCIKPGLEERNDIANMFDLQFESKSS